MKRRTTLDDAADAAMAGRSFNLPPQAPGINAGWAGSALGCVGSADDLFGRKGRLRLGAGEDVEPGRSKRRRG